MCYKRLLLTLVSLSSWAESKNQMDGEFVAGSFILTQKSLSEAPHRYATVLREVLDKVANRKDWSYTKDDFAYMIPKICKVEIQRAGEHHNSGS